MTGANGVSVDNIVNWFNNTIGKQKKIYIKPIFQGAYADAIIKVQATLQSGNKKSLPDLVQLNGAGAFSIKESKYVLYMEDLMNTDKSFNVKNKLNKNALWGCSYKGKQLGMPFSNSMAAFYYNATAFKAVGLDPDSAPKTLDDLANAGKAGY
jgi:sn-glycerol 3-phosphate transport system substrate-binding protein